MALEDVQRTIGDLLNGMLDFVPEERHGEAAERAGFPTLDAIVERARPARPRERILTASETREIFGNRS